MYCIVKFYFFSLSHRHADFRLAPATVAAGHAADNVQAGRDHHAADRADRFEPQRRDDRRDTADAGRDERRDQGVPVQPLRGVRVRRVAVRPVRPLVRAPDPTASVPAAGQEHTRARAHRARIARRVPEGITVRAARARRRRVLEPRRRRVLRRGGREPLRRQRLPPTGRRDRVSRRWRLPPMVRMTADIRAQPALRL